MDRFLVKRQDDHERSEEAAAQAIVPLTAHGSQPVAVVAAPSRCGGLPAMWETLRAASQGLTAASSPDICLQLQTIAAPQFWRRSEADVRHWAARCLAEGLRAFAPEPPLSAEGVHGALQLFLEELQTGFAVVQGAPAAGESEQFAQAASLLSDLGAMRAFLLAFDCPAPQEMMEQLTELILCASREQRSAQFEGLFSEVLATVLVEAEALPVAVVQMLLGELACIQRQPDAATGVAKAVLSALAKDSLMRSVDDALTQALFTDMTEVESDSILRIVLVAGKVYETVFELWAIRPQFVTRVLQNLPSELQSPCLERRLPATRLVAQLLAAKGEGDDFEPLAETHPSLLEPYLGRFDDAEDAVRMAAVESAPAMLAAALSTEVSGSRSVQPGRTAALSVAERVRQQLAQRSLDPSLPIRHRAIEIVTEICHEPAGVSFLLPILPEVYARVLDKKAVVREACLLGAAQLYEVHAIPAALAGRFAAAERLGWVPRLFCEAYAAFAAVHVGHTAQIEECLERSVLGCHSKYRAEQRSVLLACCFAAVGQSKRATKGMEQLLARKRAANAALKLYVKQRIAKGAPVIEEKMSTSTALVAIPEDGKIASGGPSLEIPEALRELVSVSPLAEDKTMRKESVQELLKRFDATRDRDLWVLLEQLAESSASDIVKLQTLQRKLAELERLLRVHRLIDISAVLRRALLCSWLTTETTSALLKVWRQTASEAADAYACSSGALAQGTRFMLKEIPRYIPEPFSMAAPDLVTVLASAHLDDADATLRALARLGKCSAVRRLDRDDMDEAERARLVQALLRAPTVIVTETVFGGSVHRRAVRVLDVLTPALRDRAVEDVLRWSEEEQASTAVLRCAVGMQFAAACLDHMARSPPCRETEVFKKAAAAWAGRARSALRSAEAPDQAVLHASVEVLAALGAESDLLEILGGSHGASFELMVLTASCCLRALRRGVMALTTTLLSKLSAMTAMILAPGSATSQGPVMLEVFSKFHRSRACNMRLVDRLRLSTTLPALFAFSPVDKQYEAAGQLLQRAFAAALQQCVARQEPLIDYAVACFLHFLSRLDVFFVEATADASNFQGSSRVCSFFLSALLQSDPSKATDLAGAVLRVTNNARQFIDRENPAADIISKAANVLRHVAEKRCADAMKPSNAAIWSSEQVCMPACLFAIKKTDDAEDTQLAIQADNAAVPPQQAVLPQAQLEGGSEVGLHDLPASSEPAAATSQFSRTMTTDAVLAIRAATPSLRIRARRAAGSNSAGQEVQPAKQNVEGTKSAFYQSLARPTCRSSKKQEGGPVAASKQAVSPASAAPQADGSTPSAAKVPAQATESPAMETCSPRRIGDADTVEVTAATPKRSAAGADVRSTPKKKRRAASLSTLVALVQSAPMLNGGYSKPLSTAESTPPRSQPALPCAEEPLEATAALASPSSARRSEEDASGAARTPSRSLSGTATAPAAKEAAAVTPRTPRPASSRKKRKAAASAESAAGLATSTLLATTPDKTRCVAPQTAIGTLPAAEPPSAQSTRVRQKTASSP
eukprot:TRINITY_DN19569_c0_g2_i2.p1 TRINITY_DN19569_c0_g2~~TRINITY_DN19569_c0_g2_i2.p1  ORF type:complete len:1540 (-),score=368.30 TRINITY_DN19569_c0_g2_i2:178-4797(-)